MTISNDEAQEKNSFVGTLLTELWKLLPQISFSSRRGSYRKGQSIGILVDKQPGEQPDTFDAGLTLFALTAEPVELANIGLAVTGSIEGQPHVKPIRRGVTNHRGCLTLKNLPVGQYHLIPAKSVVTSEIPLPFSQTTRSVISRSPSVRKGEFSAHEAELRVGYCEDEVRLPPYQEYHAEDGTLHCTLYESEGEFLLYFEAVLTEVTDVWVEYVIVESDTEQVVNIERQGQRIDLTGLVQLHSSENGRHTHELSLGRDIVVPQLCHLRAYLVPAPSQRENPCE